MKIKSRGYVVPVAIGVLVVASLGLLLSSWWSKSQKKDLPLVSSQKTASSTAQILNKKSLANDDATLDADSAAIEVQIKALDNSNLDVDGGLNDSSTF